MMAFESYEKSQKSGSKCNRDFLIGLGRACAGAIIFALPLLMTMEMWNLGFYIDPLKRALMILMSIPLLVGLSHVFGFEATFGWQDDLIDAFVALAVGFICSAIILWVLGEIDPSMNLREVLGKIELQMLPASIGALLAQSQLGAGRGDKKKGDKEDDNEQEERATSYFGEIFQMTVGALFLSLSIAPTEEIILIAYRISFWEGFQLCLLSLALMHAFVYIVDFKGTEKAPDQGSSLSIFLRFTVVGYAAALVIAMFVLWLLDRTNGLSPGEIVMVSVVLGFPSALGASAARLII